MMYKRLMLLILALGLLLSGCGDKTPPETTPAPTTTAATTEATTPPTTTEATEPPTTQETEPPVLFRNPLTGVPQDGVTTQRPYSVVINNIEYAQPLHGIGQADMLFEIVAEGGGSITRMLALYSDPADVEKIGSVRSARTYFIDLSEAFDAILIHAGYSNYAGDMFVSTAWNHVNGLEGFAYSYFFRDQDRLNSGYAVEHTLFTTGQDILDVCREKGFTLEREAIDYGFTFLDDATPQGDPAGEITLSFYQGGKKTRMVYDQETGSYHGTQIWGKKERELRDANTDTLVDYENVLILNAKTTTDGYRVFAELVGSGTGYYACGGQIIPIQWTRSGEREPFAFTRTDGTPISLGVGRSYVGIIPSGSPVSYQ